MQVPKSTKSDMYPEFIRIHKVVQSYAKQQKVFPKIGLKNTSINLSLAKTDQIEDKLIVHINDLRQLLNNEVANQDTYYGVNDMVNDEKRKTFHDIVYSITVQMKKNPSSFVKKDKKKVSLILPITIDVFGLSVPAGTELLEAIKLIKNRSALPYLSRLDALVSDKNSFIALQDKGIKVVFSGSGEKGLWDLATMSMRGINSCQRWGNGHAKSLVGSMVDPYAGIIYITDGKTEPYDGTDYGTNMIRRSVVRFIVHKKSRRPAILIERIYPHSYDSGIPDQITLAAFTDFIKKKTKGKFPVIYGDHVEAQGYFIPITKSVAGLDVNSGERSYRDSKITYDSSPKYKDVSKL